jgi:hypothetical protein
MKQLTIAQQGDTVDTILVPDSIALWKHFHRLKTGATLVW